MDRRSLIKAGLFLPFSASAFVKSASAEAVPRQCFPSPDLAKIERSRAAKTIAERDFFPAFYKSNQLSLVGDSNHSEPEVELFFWSERHINWIIESGVKHVFPEIDALDQFRIDLAIQAAKDETLTEETKRALQSIFWYENGYLQRDDKNKGAGLDKVFFAPFFESF